MTRQAIFTAADFLHSAAHLVAQGGPPAATMAAILRHAQAPAGSLYYRYHSRDELLGELWLSLVESYQQQFLTLLRRGDGLTAALFTPRWTRAHRTEARVLLLHKARDFAADRWPPAFVQRAQQAADQLREGLRQFVQTGDAPSDDEQIQKTRFALIDVPYAAVRRYLSANQPIPHAVDDWVRTCYLALTRKAATPSIH